MWYLLIFWFSSTGGSNGGVSSTVEAVEFQTESSCESAVSKLRELRSDITAYNHRLVFTCVKK